jgi:hypothetical protein
MADASEIGRTHVPPDQFEQTAAGIANFIAKVATGADYADRGTVSKRVVCHVAHSFALQVLTRDMQILT